MGFTDDQKFDVSINSDRARCFQQVMVYQKTLSCLFDFFAQSKSDDETFIPQPMYNNIIEKFSFFFGAAGTSKGIVDAAFADRKAKIRDAMLATSGKIATASKFQLFIQQIF